MDLSSYYMYDLESGSNTPNWVIQRVKRLGIIGLNRITSFALVEHSKSTNFSTVTVNYLSYTLGRKYLLIEKFNGDILTKTDVKTLSQPGNPVGDMTSPTVDHKVTFCVRFFLISHPNPV
jgi:hypothetical protein